MRENWTVVSRSWYLVQRPEGHVVSLVHGPNQEGVRRYRCLVGDVLQRLWPLLLMVIGLDRSPG